MYLPVPKRENNTFSTRLRKGILQTLKEIWIRQTTISPSLAGRIAPYSKTVDKWNYTKSDIGGLLLFGLPLKGRILRGKPAQITQEYFLA